MGYYTKLKLSIQLNENAPLDILEKLCNGEMMEELFIEKFGKIPNIMSVASTPELPINHDFGKTHRWDQIFHESTSIFNKETKILKIECDIKEYEQDYEKLIDWLKPYIITGEAKSKGEDQDTWVTLYP